MGNWLNKSGLTDLKNILKQKFTTKVDVHPSNTPAGKFLQTNENGYAVWGDAASPSAVAAATESWLDDNVSGGQTIAVDSSLTVEGAAADAKAAGDIVKVSSSQPTATANKLWINSQEAEYEIPTMDEFDDLKSALSEETRNLWEFGNQSFTKSVTLIPTNMIAGTYTLSAIISSQLTECRVTFYYEDSGTYKNINVQFTPNTQSRVSGTVTLPNECVQIILYSGASASASKGYTASYTDIQIESGSSASEYIPHITAKDYIVREDIEEIDNNLSVIEQDITELNEKHNSLFVATRNLWERGDSSNTNKDFTGLSYPVAKYTLSLKASGNESSFKWYAYSENHQVGSGDIIATSARQSFVVSTDEPIVRMYFNCPAGTTVTEIQLEKRIYIREKYSTSQSLIYAEDYPYATDYIEPYAVDDAVSREMLSHWDGKIINFNGDSITAGTAGESGLDEGVAYVNTIKDIIHFAKVNNYAIGSSRFARDSGSNIPSLVDRYTRMDTTADIVFIMMNTNDYAAQIPIGTDDSTDPTTYKGAMNIVFSWLRETYPGKQVIISTMPTRRIYSNRTITLEQYRDAIIYMVHKYKFILYDAYLLLGMDWNWEYEQHAITGVYYTTRDALHPNEVGAEIMGRKIAEFIKQQ